MQHAHITIGGKPFCDWLGCQAGQDIAAKAAASLGVDAFDITCGHRTGASAKKVAQALRSFFCVPVKVVAGDCPEAI